MFDFLTDAFGSLQRGLFEYVGAPLLYALGLGNLLEDGYVATGWLLMGVLEIAVMLTALRALERWRPVEAVTDPAAIRTDVVYTLIHRLGLFRLAMFFTLDPLWDGIAGALHVAGVASISLDNLWPGVTDIGWVSFGLYLLLFDFLAYLLHRAQHAFDWWWQLHALHHSQRQMTLWSDNRNHLLDSVLTDSLFVLVALGGHPAGAVRRHRGHHPAAGKPVARECPARLRPAVRARVCQPALSPPAPCDRRGPRERGRWQPGRAQLRGAVPGVGPAVRYRALRRGLRPHRVRDQLTGRDYGHGFWAQQWLGLKSLLRH